MTGREVYDLALALINERDSEGNYHNDTEDFEKNAPALLELAVAELWRLDCKIRGIAPRDYRYALEGIRSLDDELPLHPAASRCASYLLASLLLQEEDMTRSERLRGMYLTLRSETEDTFVRCEHQTVRDVYS